MQIEVKRMNKYRSFLFYLIWESISRLVVNVEAKTTWFFFFFWNFSKILKIKQGEERRIERNVAPKLLRKSIEQVKHKRPTKKKKRKKEILHCMVDSEKRVMVNGWLESVGRCVTPVPTQYKFHTSPKIFLICSFFLFCF